MFCLDPSIWLAFRGVLLTVSVSLCASAQQPTDDARLVREFNDRVGRRYTALIEELEVKLPPQARVFSVLPQKHRPCRNVSASLMAWVPSDWSTRTYELGTGTRRTTCSPLATGSMAESQISWSVKSSATNPGCSCAKTVSSP